MEKFSKHHFNVKTIFLQPAPPNRIPFQDLEPIIQNGLNNRATTNPNYRPPNTETDTIRKIVESGHNQYNIGTYHGTNFQSIPLLQQENIFDTRQFCLTCITFFITPAMVTEYNTKQLLHYAYIISINPAAIYRICNTPTVNLQHDYYKDLFKLQ